MPYTQAECVRALIGLALPRASHPGEIALAVSRRLCSTLVVVTMTVLFVHAVVTVAKNRAFAHYLHRGDDDATLSITLLNNCLLLMIRFSLCESLF